MKKISVIFAAVVLSGCGGGVNILPEPFTRERADGKIPVKTELIRAQVRKELDGMPEGEAEVARWQAIERDYNNCRLSSAESSKEKAEEVFSVCMSEKGYVYMFPIDAEQLHDDIAFAMEKKRDAAERKAEEDRIAAGKRQEEERFAAEKKTEDERIAAEKKRERDIFIAAVKTNDIEKVRRLIAEGASPNTNFEKGRAALMWAAAKGYTEIAEILLAAGANVNGLVFSHPTEDTPEGKQMRRAFIKTLPSPKFRQVIDNLGLGIDIDNATPEDAQMVRQYLDTDPDGNVLKMFETDNELFTGFRDYYGYRTALINAARGHTKIVKMLLAAGADVNATRKNGGTALMTAAGSRNAEIVKLLLAAGADVNAAEKDGTTALMWTADWGGHTEVIKILLAAGADVNATRKNGGTALMAAVKSNVAKGGHSEVVNVLLAAGANINATDDEGNTAWFYAKFVPTYYLSRVGDGGINIPSYYENTELADALTAAGAKTDEARVADARKVREWEAEEKQSEKWQEYHNEFVRANVWEDAATVESWLNGVIPAKTIWDAETLYIGISPDASFMGAGVWEGQSALQGAIGGSDDDAKKVKLLLDAGASPDREFSAGNPFEFHQEDGTVMTMEMKEMQFNGMPLLMFASGAGYTEIVKLFIAAEANPNATDENGSTALIEAALGGHSEVVNVLLAAGAKVNHRKKEGGWVALMAAVQEDYPEIAKMLLDCGASPLLKNKHGGNSWDYAQTRPSVLPVFEEYQRKLDSGWRPQPCNGRRVAAVAKPPSETNIAENVFAKVWRSVVAIRQGENQGSGVIIRPNVVATNCHNIESGGKIVVYQHDNRLASSDTLFNASVRHRDSVRDFCLLNVGGLNGTPAKIRRYNSLGIGEDVYAVGSPQGLDLSLSSGLISQFRQGNGLRYIQTDAAISPGSSGGGLFDSDGNLIGITTEKIADENVEGIGFAIPADLAADY